MRYSANSTIAAMSTAEYSMQLRWYWGAPLPVAQRVVQR
jgi:hypothetical protein